MLKPTTNEEFDLVAACCQGVSIQEELTARFHENLDWQKLLRIAQGNKVDALVFETLKKLPAALIPETVSQVLKKRFDENVRRTLALAAELIILLRLLDGAGVVALPWKGPMLAKRVYGQVFLRQFIDLDILVPEASWTAALALLQERGYRPMRDGYGEPQRAVLDPDRYCLLLYNEALGIGVELHWRFAAQSFRLDFDYPKFWAESSVGDFFGAPARLAPAEVELINLCAHGSKHYWKRLSWICDVHFSIVANNNLDWDLVFNSARKLRCARMLRLGLLLGRRILGTSLPSETIRIAEQDRGAVSLAAKIHDRLQRGTNILATEANPDAISPWNFQYMLAVRENWGDGLSQVCRVLRAFYTPNANDRAVIPLPRALHPLYFVVRPIRLALALVSKSVKNTLRDRVQARSTGFRSNN
jgi:hypothetical protein